MALVNECQVGCGRSTYLVKIGKGRQVCEDRKEICRRVLHVRRDTRLDLVRLHSDVHIHLLKRSDLIVFAIGQEHNGPHHPRPRRKQEQTRILAAFRLRNETDFEIEGDLVNPFCLPYPQVLCELFCDSWLGPANNAAIKLNAEAFSTVH